MKKNEATPYLSSRRTKEKAKKERERETSKAGAVSKTISHESLQFLFGWNMFKKEREGVLIVFLCKRKEN